MTIVDNAVYVDGHRTADPEGLEETYFVLRQRQGMAWIGLYRPDAEELRSVAEEFDLSHLAVEDALAGHQRAKLEHYGETLFLVLRPARYLDDLEKVEFGEIHVFVGRGLRGHSPPCRIAGPGPGPPADGVPARVPGARTGCRAVRDPGPGGGRVRAGGGRAGKRHRRNRGRPLRRRPGRVPPDL